MARRRLPRRRNRGHWARRQVRRRPSSSTPVTLIGGYARREARRRSEAKGTTPGGRRLGRQEPALACQAHGAQRGRAQRPHPAARRAAPVPAERLHWRGSGNEHLLSLCTLTASTQAVFVLVLVPVTPGLATHVCAISWDDADRSPSNLSFQTNTGCVGWNPLYSRRHACSCSSPSAPNHLKSH